MKCDVLPIINNSNTIFVMSKSMSLCFLVSVKPGTRFNLATHALIDIVLNM
jgi:hypothetical protein